MHPDDALIELLAKLVKSEQGREAEHYIASKRGSSEAPEEGEAIGDEEAEKLKSLLSGEEMPSEENEMPTAEA